METKPSVPFEKLIVVATEIWNNLQDGPFTDSSLTFDSINAIVPYLENNLKEEKMSPEWMDSVYNASTKNYPCLINFDGEVWSFHSAANPKTTRQDVARALADVHKQMKKGNVRFQGADGKEIKMNRADRRARAKGMKLGH